MCNNVILVDHIVSPSWEYKEAIEKVTQKEWQIVSCVNNKLHGNVIKNLLRYVSYFWFSFKCFLKRNNYSNIIAWQQFYGLLFAFYCNIFKVKNAPKIFIMTFIYKPKSKFYDRFIRYIINSNYITKLIVLSDSEREYYSNYFGVSKDLFYCTRIGVADESKRFSDYKKEKYFLSVGRSNRDYSFLRDAWKKEYGKLIIISDSYKEKDKENIICLRNCYGDEYLQLVANCYAEIISLKDKNISSGSLSFLQAMMLSKPTIVTENNTVSDYIISGYNGYIIEKSEQSLNDAISKLNDLDNYNKICTNARTEYVEKYSEFVLGTDIGRMIKKYLMG